VSILTIHADYPYLESDKRTADVGAAIGDYVFVNITEVYRDEVARSATLHLSPRRTRELAKALTELADQIEGKTYATANEQPVESVERELPDIAALPLSYAFDVVDYFKARA
jgi:hypothetical protein